MAALIGALRVSLSADTAKFEAGMKRAQRSAHTASSGINKSMGLLKSGLIGLASGLSIGLFIRGIQGALDYAGSLAEVSQQLGVTTKDLQVLRFAAGQVGVSQEQLETGLSKLTITLGKVAAGAKAPAEALKAIGLNAQEIARMDTGDAFRAIADGLANVANRAERAAVEVALFGKTGSKLDNLLAGGSGAINELSAAAERLGIVLSDEQIRKADETADKLAAMKTVLSARIAGVVADNADAILQLANALADVAAATAQAFGGIAKLFDYIRRNTGAVIDAVSALSPALGLFAQAMNAISGGGSGNVRGLNKAGKSVTVALPSVRNAPAGGRNIGQFLAPGGGGKKKGGADDAERKRLEALRNAHQLDEEMRRAQVDILRAQRELAHRYIDRNTISVQILDAEREGFRAQLEYEVAAKEKTKAQADALLLLYDQKDSLERLAIIEEEHAQAREDSARLDQVSADLDRDKLESQLQLAETAKEERRLRLLILDHLYRTERARLEAVIADEKASDLAREEARRRLQGLDETQANDRQGVMQGTRGPWEEFSHAATDAQRLEEAFQSVAVNGVGALTDGLLDAIEGTKSLGEAFREVAQGIIRELLRIMIQKIIVQAIGGAVGGSFAAGGYTGNGFAVGGFTGVGSHRKIAGVVHAREFVLNAEATRRLGVPNLNALNRGAPMSAVSNDNNGMMHGPVTININAPMTREQARETGQQAYAGWRAGVAKAARTGIA